MKILITGAAGFIGYHVCKKLLELGHTVVGIDNLNDYYDVNLKKSRQKILQNEKNFKNYNINIENIVDLKNIFKNLKEFQKN